MNPIVTFLSTTSTRKQMEDLIERLPFVSSDITIEHIVLNNECCAIDSKSSMFLNVATVDPNRFIIVTTPKIAQHHYDMIYLQRGWVISSSYSSDDHNSIPPNGNFKYVIEDDVDHLSVVQTSNPVMFDEFTKTFVSDVNELIAANNGLRQFPISFVHGSLQCTSYDETIKNISDVDTHLVLDRIDTGVIYSEQEAQKLRQTFDYSVDSNKQYVPQKPNPHEQKRI